MRLATSVQEARADRDKRSSYRKTFRNSAWPESERLCQRVEVGRFKRHGPPGIVTGSRL